MTYLPDYIVDARFKEGVKYLIKLKYDVEIIITIRSLLTEEIYFDVELFTKYCNILVEEIHRLTKNRKKRINILYYQTYNEKRLPIKKGDIITCNEVNSGLCYMNSTEDMLNIIIHRKEEFFKVLIHEMLHLYDVIPYDSNFDKHVEEIFGIKVKTNEAMVELNAVILNNIIIKRIYNISLEELLKEEYMWSIKKVRQLMNHFGITVLEEVKYKWKESTNVFAYYVVKTLLLILIYYPENIMIDNIYKDEDRFEKLLMTINDAEKMKLT